MSHPPIYNQGVYNLSSLFPNYVREGDYSISSTTHPFIETIFPIPFYNRLGYAVAGIENETLTALFGNDLPIINNLKEKIPLLENSILSHILSIQYYVNNYDENTNEWLNGTENWNHNAFFFEYYRIFLDELGDIFGMSVSSNSNVKLIDIVLHDYKDYLDELPYI